MSIPKAVNLSSFSHGYDDIGFAQTAGVISSVARHKTGQYAKYAAVTASAAHNLTKGQPINITGTTDYDGPTRVLEIVSSTVFVIKRAFTVTKSGAWDMKAAIGNWDAFIPMGAGVSGANMTFEFWDPNQQGGNDAANDFTQNVVYPVPGGIKRVGIGTAGNIRLIRAATTKPYFAKQSKSVPTIVGYNPTGAAVGATIDIIGTNFDPIPDRNAVRFTNGVRANVIAATEEILTIVVPVGTVSGVVANICNGGQNATGPTFVVN
jgi:hypothetical protein